MRLFAYCLVSLACLVSFNCYAFDSSNSVEASFEYQGELILNQADLPDVRVVDQLVAEQIWYLMGGLAHASTVGVPKSDQKISDISIRVDANNPRVLHVGYSYKSTAIFKDSVGDEVSFVLPLDPKNVFKAAAQSGHTRCVQYKDYDTEDYFFYYWNPALPGCPLKENIDYKVFHGRVTKKPKLPLSYPEYKRLVQPDGDITISFFAGVSVPRLPKREPMGNQDWGGIVYMRVRQELAKLGFKGKVLTDAEIRATLPIPVVRMPYMEDLYKDVSVGGRAKRIHIRTYFGDTDLKSDSEVFEYMLKDTFENSSVLIYTGHSGLGSSLGVTDIERTRGIKIQLPVDRYQIYFFHSCSSYFYYNDYFKLLKTTPMDPTGTKNLDVLTNGITTFDHGADNSIPLLDAIDDWAMNKRVWSYQDILKAAAQNTMFSVSGEEDNP